MKEGKSNFSWRDGLIIGGFVLTLGVAAKVFLGNNGHSNGNGHAPPSRMSRRMMSPMLPPGYGGPPPGYENSIPPGAIPYEGPPPPQYRQQMPPGYQQYPPQQGPPPPQQQQMTPGAQNTIGRAIRPTDDYYPEGQMVSDRRSVRMATA